MRTLAVPKFLKTMFGWKRVVFVLICASAIGGLLSLGWEHGAMLVLPRTVALAVAALIMFGAFEQWPRALPPWCARWVLQVLAVGIAMPVLSFLMWRLSTPAGAPPFWRVPDRMTGFMTVAGIATLLAPWIALGALVRQKDALARHQALTFQLERSELQRQTLDARLSLLQAQVAPHFLFNTLANVQALADAGSPRAPDILRSLTAYLRAAVPRLDGGETTIGQEVDQTQAYLELMLMRMPDRLAFTLDVDKDARALRCPPMTLLTLVENAVRHGIDPSEEGGRIDVTIKHTDGRCVVRVDDSGAGLGGTGGLGTGLANLRERLALLFDETVRLEVQGREPCGVMAEVSFPARIAVA